MTTDASGANPPADPRDDYDSPWKIILARYLREAFEQLFPAAAAAIDWGRGVTALEGELQALRPDADSGRRYVDQLVSVRLRDGTERRVLVHVEVQAAPVRDFARRMFLYSTRLMHLHAEPVASFAILADEDPRWLPTGHHSECLGCRHRFDFPTVKLLALGPPDDSLFGRVLGAYRAARSTRKRPQARLAMKISLVQALYGQGFSPEEVRDLYTFIDWVLRLPLDLEFRFHETLQQFEEEHAMQYVTTAERIGIEKGRIEGIELGRHEGEVRLLTRLLERRFGTLPLWAVGRLAGADLETLERWGERVLDDASLVEVLS